MVKVYVIRQIEDSKVEVASYSTSGDSVQHYFARTFENGFPFEERDTEVYDSYEEFFAERAKHVKSYGMMGYYVAAQVDGEWKFAHGREEMKNFDVFDKKCVEKNGVDEEHPDLE